MRFVPHPYQQYAIGRIIADDKVALFLDCGLGKTVITLTAINDLRFNRWAVSKCLVVAPNATAMPGRLRVSFFWFFYSDYNVLELGPDYDWALVGGGSSKYLWILSRTPRLPSRTLNHILRLAEARGYRTGKLLFVDQGQGISPPLP